MLLLLLLRLLLLLLSQCFLGDACCDSREGRFRRSRRAGEREVAREAAQRSARERPEATLF